MAGSPYIEPVEGNAMRAMPLARTASQHVGRADGVLLQIPARMLRGETHIGTRSRTKDNLPTLHRPGQRFAIQ